MTMTVVHTWAGYAIVGSWAIVGAWALVLRLMRRDETPTFWWFVSLAQIILGLQLVVGAVLLLMGRLPAATVFDNVFHILYGFAFPVVVLVFAHRWSQQGRFDPHVVFAVVGLVNFGLTARALMTGLGV